MITMTPLVLEDMSVQLENEREARNAADMQKLKDWVRA